MYLLKILFAAGLLLSCTPVNSQDSDLASLREKVKAVKGDTTLKLIIVSGGKDKYLYARTDAAGNIVITEYYYKKENRVYSTKCYFDYIDPYCIEKSSHYNASNKSSIPAETQWYFNYEQLMAKEGAGKNVPLKETEVNDLIKEAASFYRKASAKLLTDPFKDLNYDKVMAWSLDEDLYHDTEGSQQEKVLAARIEKNGVLLSSKQVSMVTQITTDTNAFKGEAASCFNPRMVLVFFKGENILGTIPVCLECNQLTGTGAIQLRAPRFNPSVHPDKGCTSCYGFTPAARKKLNELCRTLNLSHCLSSYDSPYDEEQK